jgi:hypothetical protein
VTGDLRAGARRLGILSAVLDMALAQWDGRDDTQPQPERRRAATEAVIAIDNMLPWCTACAARWSPRSASARMPAPREWTAADLAAQHQRGKPRHVPRA